MGLADLHIHTNYSWDGTNTVPGVLNYVTRHTGLDVIAITDHDEVDGALEGLELTADYGISVIPGSEISTADGQLLALFVYQRVQPNLPLADTILRVGELGGLCIASHPLAGHTGSLSGEAIRKALVVPGVAHVLVGIEAFSGGLVHRSMNVAAFALALSLPLAQIAGSDSHVLATIGRGATRFPGCTPVDLRRALLTRSTEALISSRQTRGLDVLRLWMPQVMRRRVGLAA